MPALRSSGKGRAARSAYPVGDVRVTIHAPNGRLIRTIEDPGLDAGQNRVVWDLRAEELPARPGRGGWFGNGLPGPLVEPGPYTAYLRVGMSSSGSHTFEVREDPRLDIPAEDRRAWHAALGEIAEVYGEAVSQLETLLHQVRTQRDTARIEDAGSRSAAMARPDSIAEAVAVAPDPGAAGERRGAGETEAAATPFPLPETRLREIEAVGADVEELFSRVARLYFEVSGWTGPMTADQRSRLEFYRRKLAETGPRVTALAP